MVWGKKNLSEPLSDWKAAIDQTFLLAARKLSAKGWQPIRLGTDVPSTVEGLQDYLRRDRCIRGLYIVAHGNTPGYFVLGRAGSEAPEFVTPDDVAGFVSPDQMDMLTILTCGADLGSWSAEFPHATITVGMSEAGGKIALPVEYAALYEHDWGADTGACDQGPLFAREWKRADEAPCYGFLEWDSAGIGSPAVMSCAFGAGIPESGSFELVDSLGTFQINSHWQPGYGDSVACTGTLLSGSPYQDVAGGWIPAGRFLLLSALARDTLVTSLGAIITLRYSEEELHALDIPEESLALYWLRGNGTVFESVASVVDTVADVISGFVDGPLGIVGLYGQADPSSAHDSRGVEPMVVVSPIPATVDIHISMDMESSDNAAIHIYDAGGRLIRSESVHMRPLEWRWNLTDDSGRRVQSGVYFALITSGTYKTGRRILVVR